MSKKFFPVRVRFAPSPTGYLHIGNLRVAIFNWLFARHNEGDFLLRIEDTDAKRSSAEYTKSILESLNWAGIDFNEPPVIQSEKKERHIELIENLLDRDKAYKCYCTQEELDRRLEKTSLDGKEYSKYDGYCRNNKSAKTRDSQDKFVVRFKIPQNFSKITFEDIIRGTISSERDQLDDFVIARSDGLPVYNFSVVVDDHDMDITHVIRGDDHISNTPKQILLYEAFEWGRPLFTHLPMILGAGGKPLSKRDAAVSVVDYKKQGFLANALCNYLTRLGWAKGDLEIFSMQEITKIFSLKDIGKKSGIFDIKKLEWLNGFYINKTNSKDLIDLIITDCDPDFLTRTSKIDKIDREKILEFVDLYKSRSKTLLELTNQVYSLVDGPDNVSLKELQKFPAEYKSILEDITLKFEKVSTPNLEIIKELIKNAASKYKVKFADVAKILRIALTGDSTGPGIGELFLTLGKTRSLKRLSAANSFWNPKNKFGE